MAAMIFAAGFGTRMRALTKTMPKPMVPLAGRPMIDHTIDLLRDAGIRRIAANTHYLPDAIEPHLRARGVEVLREAPEILDTGGGLRHALPLLGNGPVITINPDALWLGRNPVLELLNAWQSDMRALLLLVPQNTAHGTENSGDFSLEHGEIRRGGPFIYGGAQVIQTDKLDEIESDVFSLNVFWDHLALSGPLNGQSHEGGWCDIGTPEGLAHAERILANV